MVARTPGCRAYAKRWGPLVVIVIIRRIGPDNNHSFLPPTFRELPPNYRELPPDYRELPPNYRRTNANYRRTAAELPAKYRTFVFDRPAAPSLPKPSPKHPTLLRLVIHKSE